MFPGFHIFSGFFKFHFSFWDLYLFLGFHICFQDFIFVLICFRFSSTCFGAKPALLCYNDWTKYIAFNTGNVIQIEIQQDVFSSAEEGSIVSLIVSVVSN